MITKEQSQKWDNLCLKLLGEPRARFLTSLLYSLKLVWSDDIPTAGTNGIVLKINPKFFYGLSKEERLFVILHELWHVAKLHSIRRESRDCRLWNNACDYHINNLLLKENYSSFKITVMKDCFKDEKFKDLSEEEIYEELLKEYPNGLPDNEYLEGHLSGDLEELDQEEKSKAIAKVMEATQTAKAMGCDVGSGITSLLSKFIKPSINWKKVLYKYMTALLDKSDYSWRKPNRRFSDIYLPSRVESDGRLTHLLYFLDVSGSIEESQIIRFNSEIKRMKESLNPDKLTLVQFDTRIRRVDVFTSTQKFTNIHVVVGGGTSYTDVRDYILKEKPTASVIFTDLCCTPMQEVDSPVIWVTREKDLKYATMPLFGKTIVIKEKD